MPNIGNLEIRNTANLLGPWTRLCVCMWSQPKRGKTTWAGKLDAITKRWYNKPTLFIACEAADGSGTMSIREMGVDYVEPKTWQEFQALGSALQTDTTYGGIVIDNVTDVFRRLLGPFVLKFPYTKGTPPTDRAMGVFAQGDYQTAGELLRTELNKYVNLTKKDTPDKVRKHLIITALEKEKTTREKEPQTISIGPDLPGAMADTASAMFQTLLTIIADSKVIPDPTDPKKTIRVKDRIVLSEDPHSSVKALGDRMKLFPARGPFDLEEVFEKYIIPATLGKAEVAA